MSDATDDSNDRIGAETYLLEVNGPDELLAFGVLDVHFEAAVGLLWA